MKTLDGAKVLGQFRDVTGLLDIMRTRVDELNISRLTLDSIARLAEGHSSKILAPHPIKGLGDKSVMKLLLATGMKLVHFAVEDAEALKRITSQLVVRKYPTAMRSVAVQYKLSSRFLKKIARKGGANSRKYMTKKKASQLARKAARARWHKPISATPAGSPRASAAARSAAPATAGSAPRRPHTAATAGR